MADKYIYLFPFEKIPQGSRIVIYGAGDVGQEYLQQMHITGYCDVVAFIDRAYDKYPPMIIPVYPVEKVDALIFDYVLLAFKMGTHVRAVTKVLLGYGIDVEKIIYTEPRKEGELLVTTQGEIKTQAYNYAYSHDGISIALKYGGGLGDAIVKKKLFTELVSMAPDCKIDVYSPGAGDIVRSIYNDQSNLNAVIDDGGALYAKERSKYDLAFTVAFMMDVDVLNQEQLELKNPDFARQMKKLQESVKKYNLSVTGVTSRYVHFQRMKFLGLNYYNYLNYTGIFKIKDHKVTIPLDVMYEKKYENLALSDNYITVNYGGGVDASGKDNGIAKDWPITHVEKFVKIFKDKYPNIKVVQIGSAGTLSIDGADEYFLGDSLELVKYILKGSMLHVDKEGGLVHLATQLGTKCIVCFGPTQVEYFGYDENINIQAGSCHGCYCLYDGFDVCARGLEKPECMWGITPEMVMERVEKQLGTDEILLRTISELAANGYENIKSNLTYYTNLDTAIKIIKNKEIWMRKISLMNDYSEFLYGENIVKKIINRKLTNKLEMVLKHLNLEKKDFYEAFEKALLLKKQVYILSLTMESENEKDDGRLSMWRAYGNEIGVAFVFNNRALIDVFASAVHDSCAKDDVLAFLFPITYGEKNKIEKDIELMFDKVLSFSPEYICFSNTYELLNAVVNNLIFAMMIQKHPGFREEKEIRFWHGRLDEPSENEDNRIIQIKDEALGGINQRVAVIKFDKLFYTNKETLDGMWSTLFEKIIIGPMQKEKGEALLEVLYDKLKATDKTFNKEKIQLSGIPYRDSLK